MILKYNIFLELAVIPLDFILCVFFQLRYGDDTKVNKEFKLLAYLVFWGTIADVVDAVMLSYDMLFSPVPLYIIHTINYCLATGGSFQFVRYVISYVGDEYSRTDGSFINRVLLLIYGILIVQNFFTGTVFSYSDSGEMLVGPLFTMVVYAFPLYYILSGGVFILSHSENYARKMKYALAATFVFMVSLYTLQMFLYRSLLVTFFAASIAILVIFLTLETPDYIKLKKTLEELSISKRELEASSIRATEASHAKTRFLAQMSNDIRTPVNAIMGYSNLILADTEEEETKEYTRRVKISAKRLLTFFESVLNYVSEESDEKASRRLPSMAELIENTDESEFMDDEGNSVRKGLTGASDMRILAVDDTPANLDILVRMLTPMGFTVDTASNGQEAVIQVRKFRYDLIFMDHLMPIMDGVKALRQLRDEKLCDNTPIIILTANAIEGEEEKYLNEGFAAYLTKPFTEDMVTDILKRFLPLKDSNVSGSMDVIAWENLQERIPMVRVADAREYTLHDIRLYKKILLEYSKEESVSRISQAIRNADYTSCMALIRSERDMAELIGADKLVKMTERLEAICRKKEFDLLRERIGAFAEERNDIAHALYEELQVENNE
ncbi:ATP-binding response regulator [Butyrivibrio sp. LC3010]|uniref:ATP-binding response regulator n=1 Tax=Butyrivibrio sp. LC3010 TaxID=1280680 RepID=UPI0003FCA13C|nr:response regulator [Butyrivibrio sp. LC3010]